MFELYGIAGIILLVVGFWVYAHIKSYQAELAKKQAEEYKAKISVFSQEVQSKKTMEAAVVTVQKELNIKHEAQQKAIDEGRRDDFDNTGF